MSCLKKRLPFLEAESKGRPESIVRKVVMDRWVFWRPIVERIISYDEALQMSDKQLQEVNMALDILIEKKNAANKVK